MAKISPAKRIRNMINGLEEIEAEYRAKRQAVDYQLRPDHLVAKIYLDDLGSAKQALERLWKQSVG